MKCSFVVPGYKCDDYIFRNVESILDQDYTNYEIIIVLNGEWETKQELFNKLNEKYSDKIQIHSIEQGGLGNANNFGITKATGDIISHLSSDLYLMPGTLRTWIDAFKENPKIGLVYSGYRLVSENPMDVFYSNRYDRYWLECEPAIDGASPYRREFAVHWNTELKSLIDWDWSLSVTEKTDALWLKEPLYYAELPKPGGLSFNSNQEWKVRRRQIQKLHNIPDRHICVTSLSEPDYGLEIAKMVNADFRAYPSFKPHDYKLIYQYGFPSDLHNLQMSVGVFAGHGKHKIIHWTGKDIIKLITNKNLTWYDINSLMERGLSNVHNHFCVTSQDYHLLTRLHLKPEMIYPPVKYEIPETPLNAVSVNEEELKWQLTRAMPDIEFRLNDLACNITVHFQDSISNILKSLCHGNHVITDQYFSGTYLIQAFSNVPELRKMIVHTIRKIINENEPRPQKDIEYYREKVTPGYFRNKLEKIAEKHIPEYARLDQINADVKSVWDA